MAFSTGSGNSFNLSDNAALTIPNSDWTICTWINSPTDPGVTYYQQWSTYNAVPSWGEYHSSGNMRIMIRDDSGNILISSDQIITSWPDPTGWVLLTRRRNGNDYEWFKDTTSVFGPNTQPSFGAVNASAAWNFALSNSYYGECAKWDRALDDEEIFAIADGWSMDYFKESRAWYVPNIRDYVERHGLTLNNSGTTVVASNALIYPQAPHLGFPSAGAPPAGNVLPPFHHHRHHNRAA